MPADSRFPRRQFLLWGGAATVSGVAAYLGLSGSEEARTSRVQTSVNPSNAKERVAVQEPAAASSGKPAISQGPFQRDAFVGHLNSEFRIELPDVTTGTCRLVEVSPATEMNTPRGIFTCFTLGFECQPGFLKEGGICRLSHPAMETMEIFLSPVGRPNPKAEKALLEAVFSLRA